MDKVSVGKEQSGSERASVVKKVSKGMDALRSRSSVSCTAAAKASSARLRSHTAIFSSCEALCALSHLQLIDPVTSLHIISLALPLDRRPTLQKGDAATSNGRRFEGRLLTRPAIEGKVKRCSTWTPGPAAIVHSFIHSPTLPPTPRHVQKLRYTNLHARSPCTRTHSLKNYHNSQQNAHKIKRRPVPVRQFHPGPVSGPFSVSRRSSKPPC